MSDKEPTTTDPGSTELAPAAPEKQLRYRERREIECKEATEFAALAVVGEIQKSHKIVEEILDDTVDDAKLPFSELTARSRIAFELAKLDHAAERAAKQQTQVAYFGIVVPPQRAASREEWEKRYEELERELDARRSGSIDVTAEEVSDVEK